MSKISWVYGILQGNGIDTNGMSPDEAFAELEKLRKSGKVSDDEIKFSKSHSDEPSKTGNTRKTNASDSDTPPSNSKCKQAKTSSKVRSPWRK